MEPFADRFRARNPRSQRLYERAQGSIAAGVNSTARSKYAGWDPFPLFIDRGEGSRLWDVDGHEYVDYQLGLGPLLLGHRPPGVTAAVVQFLRDHGTLFSAPYELETEAAERFCAAVPCADLVRFANSGTEADLTALRLARAYTGRPKILRFEGMYHGWADTAYWSNHPPLDEAGPLERPRPVVAGPGIPELLASTVVVAPWNEPDILADILAREGEQIAAIITEPVMLNTGCILPKPGYLKFLRAITRQYGILLVFDEVITGFRLALGGAQEYYGVVPDLATFAKGLGGGFPVAAIAGSREVMAPIADGRYSHSGTYNANGIAIAAVVETLTELSAPGVYEQLFAIGDATGQVFQEAFSAQGVPVNVVGVGPVFQVWFADHPIHHYRDAMIYASKKAFTVMWQELVMRGVYMHPKHVENLFTSCAHSMRDVERTAEILADAMPAITARLQEGE